MHLLFLLSILSLCAVASTAQPSSDDNEQTSPFPPEENEETDIDGSKDHAHAVFRIHDFSVKYGLIAARQNPPSFVMSPLGNFLSFSMAMYGAQGKTKDFFVEGLLLASKPDSIFGLQSLVADLDSYKEDGLRIANSFFHSPEVRIRSEYSLIVQHIFRSPVQTVDLEDAAKKNSIIQKSCERQTGNRMENIGNPGMVMKNEEGNAAVEITNAVYFEGEWVQKFEAANTANRMFYLDDGSEKPLPTMAVEGFFRHGNIEDIATFVELPFASKDNIYNLSMVIVLPNERKGLTEFEESFNQFFISEFVDEGTVERLSVQIPKFTVASEIDIKAAIEKIPYGQEIPLFDPEVTDFNGAAVNIGLYLDEVVQNNVIKIDEKGSKAAAEMGCNRAEESVPEAVPVSLDTSSDVGGPSFIANHAFYASIVILDPYPMEVFTVRFNG